MLKFFSKKTNKSFSSIQAISKSDINVSFVNTISEKVKRRQKYTRKKEIDSLGEKRQKNKNGLRQWLLRIQS